MSLETEAAILDGCPLIHYDARRHKAPLSATVSPSVHVGQKVVLRDSHSGEQRFGTVTALDRTRGKATLHVP